MDTHIDSKMEEILLEWLRKNATRFLNRAAMHDEMLEAFGTWQEARIKRLIDRIQVMTHAMIQFEIDKAIKQIPVQEHLDEVFGATGGRFVSEKPNAVEVDPNV